MRSSAVNINDLYDIYFGQGHILSCQRYSNVVVIKVSVNRVDNCLYNIYLTPEKQEYVEYELV